MAYRERNFVILDERSTQLEKAQRYFEFRSLVWFFDEDSRSHVKSKF